MNQRENRYRITTGALARGEDVKSECDIQMKLTKQDSKNCLPCYGCFEGPIQKRTVGTFNQMKSQQRSIGNEIPVTLNEEQKSFYLVLKKMDVDLIHYGLWIFSSLD